MSTTDERLDAAIREALDEPRNSPSDHPEPDVLLAYHEDELSEPEAEAVRDHLAACLECSQVILDFAAFPDLEPATEAHRATSADMRHEWSGLQERIAAGRSPWWRSHEYVGLPAAALFLVAVLGLGVWAWQLRESNASLQEKNVDLQAALTELERPDGDVSLVTLLPASELSRGAGEVPVVRRTDNQSVVLILAAVERFEGAERYSMDVRNSSGDLLLEELSLRRHPNGTFVVSLPNSLLAMGASTLEVYGESQDGRELIDEYPVTFNPDGWGWIDGSDLGTDRADP